MPTLYRVKIRISRVYDYELYCLYRTIKEREFSKLARDILVSFTRNEQFSLPYITDWVIPENGDKKSIAVCYLTIPETMTDVINILENITDSKKSAFIKAIMKTYLADLILPLYFQDSQLDSRRLQTRLKKKPVTLNKTSEKMESELSSLLENDIHKETTAAESKDDNISVESETTTNDIDDMAALFGGIKIL